MKYMVLAALFVLPLPAGALALLTGAASFTTHRREKALLDDLNRNKAEGTHYVIGSYGGWGKGGTQGELRHSLSPYPPLLIGCGVVMILVGGYWMLRHPL